jgi:hypothetical protein
MYPEVQTFSLPYLLLTRNYIFNQEFRVRFSKNCFHVIVIGDALTLGLTRGFIASEAFKRLWDPRRFVRLIGNGVKWTYANFPAAEFSRAICLPKPIFRYWSLFPRNHLKKLVGQARIFDFAHYNEEVDILKPYVDDPSTFWKISSAHARVNGSIGRSYPESLRFVKNDEHPRIMQDFFSDQSSAHDSYYVRQEVLNELRGL